MAEDNGALSALTSCSLLPCSMRPESVGASSGIVKRCQTRPKVPNLASERSGRLYRAGCPFCRWACVHSSQDSHGGELEPSSATGNAPDTAWATASSRVRPVPGLPPCRSSVEVQATTEPESYKGRNCSRSLFLAFLPLHRPLQKQASVRTDMSFRRSSSTAMDDRAQHDAPPPAKAGPQPFSHTFWSPEVKGQRTAYFKIIFRGMLLVCIVILTVLALYWGALHSFASHHVL